MQLWANRRQQSVDNLNLARTSSTTYKQNSAQSLCGIWTKIIHKLRILKICLKICLKIPKSIGKLLKVKKTSEIHSNIFLDRIKEHFENIRAWEWEWWCKWHERWANKILPDEIINRSFAPQELMEALAKQEAQGSWNLSTALQNISYGCVRECISML